MAAADYGRVLLQVADQLRAELWSPGDRTISIRQTLGDQGPMAGVLDPADEALVRRLRRALEEIAAALGLEADGQRARAVWLAIDGAELVMRRELVAGNADQLLRLLPSFLFLTALPITEQDRALELSRRATELITKATSGF